MLETTGTCRYFTDEPVPHGLLAQLIDAARFAPTGANRQGVRFVVVTDPAKRRALSNLYLSAWEATLEQVRQQGLSEPFPKQIRDADHFARHFGEIPVLVVVCASIDDLLPTDTALGRVSIVGGASVYPAVQNLLLKSRELGLGAALTTNLCQFEPQIKYILANPDGVATAATIAIGFPARPFPTKLSRLPIGELAYLDEYGKPVDEFAAAPPR